MISSHLHAAAQAIVFSDILESRQCMTEASFRKKLLKQIILMKVGKGS